MMALAVFATCALVASGCDKKSTSPVDPRAHAEGLYLLGTTQYLQGKFDEALSSFAEMEKLLPGDPRLPAAKGEIYLSQGKVTDALAQYQKAAAQDPKRSTNWSRIGFIENMLGHADEARSALRKAIGLNPHDYTALEALGDLEQKQGHLDQAVTNFSLAAEASPNSEAASGLWIRASRELEKAHRDDDARKLLQGAVGRGSSSPEVLAEYGGLLVRAHRFEDALPVLTDAAKQNGRDPMLWQMVGELEVALDKPADAMLAFRESLKIKDRTEVHAALARLHRAREDDKAAQEELELALQAATGEEAESRELAKLLTEFGRKKDALAILSALAEEPEKKNDVALQVQTAKLAKEVGAGDTVKAACARVKSAPEAGVRACP